jgi:hypothetical protein
MKKTILILLLVTVNQFGFSQEKQKTSVEKSIFGIQTGLLGIWVNNESRISNELALRSEIGYSAGLFGGDFYPKTGYLMVPTFRVEPRWYYNLKKRVSKSRKIANNSGNFLTLQTTFYPNFLILSNYENVKIVNQISLIPTWGIKRTIGNHFTYETAIGFGHTHYFAKNSGYEKDNSNAALNLHLRIGYSF